MNTRFSLCLLAVLLVVCCADTASAQRRWFAPGRPYGWGWRAYGGATTPQSAAQHGMADVVRSTGEYNEKTSRAMINYEQARSAYIDNKKKWTETYWERRRTGQAAREEEYAEKRAARDRYLANKESGMPERLTSSQLDPSTGHINWPAALLSDKYAEYREKLQQMLVAHTHTSGTSELSTQIYQTARAMQAELRKEIRDLPTMDYIEGRKFLDSLAFEGRYPPG